MIVEARPAEAFFWEGYRYRSGPFFDFRAPRYARPKAKRAKAAPAASAIKDGKNKTAPAKGPLHVVVSIAQQRVVVYDDGVEIAQAPVSTGTPSHPTPTGVFTIIQKRRFHHSNLYSNAPMPYMQRITWSGIALHEGPLPGYPASHGCIRLPAGFAQKLWSMTKLGARVIVAHDAVSPVEMSHPVLLKPRPMALRPTITEDAAADAPKFVQTAHNAADATHDVVGQAAASPTAVRQENLPDVTGTTVARASLADVDTELARRQNAARAGGPITVFISRKEGRLFVRQDFKDVFDMPIAIRDPQAPIGTHVATAMAFDATGSELRWSVMTVPERKTANADTYAKKLTRGHGKSESQARRAETPPPSPALAAKAFDRITLPAEAAERIADLLTPGATMIVSDHGRGPETGKGTDFVVLTR